MHANVVGAAVGLNLGAGFVYNATSHDLMISISTNFDDMRKVSFFNPFSPGKYLPFFQEF